MACILYYFNRGSRFDPLVFQVRGIRHSLAAALTADACGVIFAVLACSFFLKVIHYFPPEAVEYSIRK